MELRGIRFRYAFDQSGVQNFGGSGYPYPWYIKPKPTFNNCTFVAKTTTLYARAGNMPLQPDGITPIERKPSCIYVSPYSWLRGAAINAVGLSGFGLQFLLEKGIWYDQHRPFQISLMAVEKTRAARISEISEMVRLIKPHLPFRSKFGVQLNISCRNVDHETQEVKEVIEETKDHLQILRGLGSDVPLMAKINFLFPIRAALEIAADDNCDAICVSNTIHWNDLPKSDRRRLFLRTKSPLAQYGGGSISGSYLLPKVAKWIQTARVNGLRKPIIAGGGILKPSDVDFLAQQGASAIAVGSVSFLRWWRVQGIIDRANELGRIGYFYGGLNFALV